MRNTGNSALFLGLAFALLRGSAGAAPFNDNFADALAFAGTNISFAGNFTEATFEPGEPNAGATNTVWLKWKAPFTGRATYHLSTAPYAQFCTVYEGPSVDALQWVTCYLVANSTYSFMATAGVEYHVQFAGADDNFSFELSQTPLLPCANDDFEDAQVIAGQTMYLGPASVVGATMQAGEPAHMGALAQKSIWWKWQAPVGGNFYLSADTFFVGPMVLALYAGDSLETLVLVGKGTNSMHAGVLGGETYYIAGAVAADSFGDVGLFGSVGTGSTPSRIVPGNLLQEPSWEGTGLGPQYWRWTGDLSGYVNERGGADGTTWPCLGRGTLLWQDIPAVVPGHKYAVKFAHRFGGPNSGSPSVGPVRVSWDGVVLGEVKIPENEGGFWHWGQLTASAGNASARVSFENLGDNLEMDAFSVVDISTPPSIVRQPESISTVSEGTAVFIVGAIGAPPLKYQWLFNGVPWAGKTSAILVVNPVSTSMAGTYQAVITNVFGAVTSAPATLVVDAPANPTIVWQPYGDTVAPGGYFSFNVAAIGELPLSFQWFRNDEPVPGGTNKNLIFTNTAPADAGTYQVRVQNAAGTAWSLAATLRIDPAVSAGGTLMCINRGFCGGTLFEAPIYDVDGATALSGTAYFAQLYAGPSIELLRPAGEPVPFVAAGFFGGRSVTLANVGPTSNAVAQVRAWDAAKGSTYEEARALGGRFGASEVLSLATGGGTIPPPCLAGLQSFKLRAGLPEFTVGTVQFVERRPGNTMVWSITGQAGYRYLIEKTRNDSVWQPFVVITNVTGTTIFTDTANSGSSHTFYRARILD